MAKNIPNKPQEDYLILIRMVTIENSSDGRNVEKNKTFHIVSMCNRQTLWKTVFKSSSPSKTAIGSLNLPLDYRAYHRCLHVHVYAALFTRGKR